jgi:hypothetical protein
MADPLKRPRFGGGILIALSTMIGAGAGVALGQPSIGMLAGIAIGAALAVLVWLLDRR